MTATRTPPVVDVHTHVASTRFVPAPFVEGAIDNMCAALAASGLTLSRERLRGRVERLFADDRCDELIAQMDGAGITHSVLQVPDFTHALPATLTIEEILRAHREIVARHAGRLTAFAGVDPRWGQDGVMLFERALRDWGFRGLKVYPPCGFRPDDPLLFPFYELCDAHAVPVLVHTGGTTPVLPFETSEPLAVDAAARRFPRVPFVLAHAPVGFTEQCIVLCRFRPNVFLDLSGFHVSLQFDGTRQALHALLHAGIGSKILFGTDWPLSRLHGTQADLVAALAGDRGLLADMTDADRDAILGANAHRLLARSATDLAVVAGGGAS